MTTLAHELTQEHTDIDAAIAAYAAAAKDGAPQPQADALRAALATLRRHIYVEETMLFPPMKAGSAFAAIFAMLREHGQMWPIIEDVVAQLDAGDADGRAGALLAELAQLLANHNDKEERTIYSQADAAHAGESAQAMLTFLNGGTMPEGWRCQRAAPANGTA